MVTRTRLENGALICVCSRVPCGPHGAPRPGRCDQCRACCPARRPLPISRTAAPAHLALRHGRRLFATGAATPESDRQATGGNSSMPGACERCGACCPRCPHGLAFLICLAHTHALLAANPPRRRPPGLGVQAWVALKRSGLWSQSVW